MTARLETYRAEWRSMNRAERRVLGYIFTGAPVLVIVAALAVAEGNWLAVCLAAGVMLAQAQVVNRLHAGVAWRNAYERERDRPRAANWRQN